MKKNKSDIQQHICRVFPNIKTQEELLQLINDIHQQLNADYYVRKNQPVPLIKMKTLTYYKDPKLSGAKRYRKFTIPKKSGKDRQILAPAKGLKLIQQCLNEIFQALYEPNEFACGFVPNRNVADGAKKHTNQPYVYNIDLKDFFDTIVFRRVKAILALPPFNLKDEREPLAFVIASLCCHPRQFKMTDKDGIEVEETRVCLPQGAPTSPILTNIVCRSLDRHLAGLAKRFHAQYSRYADDISFSCHYNIFKKDSDFIKEMHRIIEEEQNLRINTAKTRLQTYSQRQEVTGLVVNNKVNVTKQYLKQIRQWLYYWERYGLTRAQHYFESSYAVSSKKKTSVPALDNVLAGKLDYMRMVVGESNPAYKKLKERYNELCGYTRKSTNQIESAPSDNIGSLLDELLNSI